MGAIEFLLKGDADLLSNPPVFNCNFTMLGEMTEICAMLGQAAEKNHAVFEILFYTAYAYSKTHGIDMYELIDTADDAIRRGKIILKQQKNN